MLQEARITFAELQLAPATLAEMISLIESSTISGKIGKQILPDLLEVRATQTTRVCGSPASLAIAVAIAGALFDVRAEPSWHSATRMHSTPACVQRGT
jgi:GatB domain